MTQADLEQKIETLKQQEQLLRAKAQEALISAERSLGAKQAYEYLLQQEFPATSPAYPIAVRRDG